MRNEVCILPSTMPRVIAVLLVFACVGRSSATIEVAESGLRFSSRPDHNIDGPRISRSHDERVRLQSLSNNSYLCPSAADDDDDDDDEHASVENGYTVDVNDESKWSVTVPEDGAPVALLVKKGGCSYEKKALAASRYIKPNVVKLLIIDGDTRQSGDEEVERHHNSRYPIPARPQKASNVKLDPEPAHGDGGPLDWITSTFVRTTSIFRSDNHSFSFDSEWGLDKKHSSGISVAVLHVSFAVGYDLKDVLEHESEKSKKLGGAVLYVNGSEPRGQFTVFLWVLFSAFLCICCCYVTVAINSGIVNEANNNQQAPAPIRPRRQRLTMEQVEAKLPIHTLTKESRSSMCGSNSNQNEGTLIVPEVNGDVEGETGGKCQPSSGYQPPDLLCGEEDCAICLDRYEIGQEVRTLPCQHVFHAACIARWLTARAAFCPMCSLNLYEEEEEEEEPEVDTNQNGETADASNDMNASWASANTLEAQATPGPEETVGRPRSWWRRGASWLVPSSLSAMLSGRRDDAQNTLAEPLLPTQTEADEVAVEMQSESTEQEGISSIEMPEESSIAVEGTPGDGPSVLGEESAV